MNEHNNNIFEYFEFEYREKQMDSFIFLGYELISAFVPFLIVFMLFRTTQKRNGISFYRCHFIATLAFFIYIAGVYHFTGAGTIYAWMRFGLEINQSQINFSPFHMILILSITF